MGRRAASGINSFLMIIIVAGIIGVLYYIAERHPVRYDLTANRTQTLSNQTMKVIGGLESDIEIIGFFEGGSLPGEMVSDLLKEYRRRTDKITFLAIDPVNRPGEAQKYGVSEMGVILISGENRKFVKMMDMFERQMNPYAQEPPKFYGEQAITNALISITGREKRRICFLEGHGERDVNAQDEGGYSGIKDLLEGENYEVSAVNLITEKKVPAGCTALAVVGPEKFFSGGEIEAVRDYINGGGAGLFLLDAMKHSGLEFVLQDWGVQVGNDLVVDPERYYGDDPLSPVPYMKYHDITAELKDSKLTVSLFYSRSVGPADDGETDAGVSVLLETSGGSWAETDMESQNAEYTAGEDMKGPVPVAVAVTAPAGAAGEGEETGGEDAGEADAPRESRLVVIGDVDFASNAFVYQSGLIKAIAGGAGNTDFLMNSFNWLSGEEDLISIRPKPTDIRPLNATGDQLKVFTALYAGVIPFAIVIIGVVIWYRRRSL